MCTADVLAVVNCSNRNVALDACLMQLPLPPHIDVWAILSAINPFRGTTSGAGKQ
ncbi:hypothetical protein [Sporisorium scitamineum]|uniref:Uncharacterized protein n=1 Tax=Sporisorium scitamineum TaxID=49012 RepID=A0A0F7RX28_9BASI|nr:hypothetical protein [Sporisorium scitamineum]